MTKNPRLGESPDVKGYQSLMPKSEWQKLHPAIQKRFSIGYQQPITYCGVMSEVSASLPGLIFAKLCRLIGTPLAPYRGKNVPMKVNVYPNRQLKGMTWDRFYYFNNRPISRISSTKCVQEDGSLAEMVGFGFAMNLRVSQQGGAIQFKSGHYFVKIFNRKIKIPNLLTPGVTKVTQTAIDQQRFEFKLEVNHPWFGQVFKQVGIFEKR
jgi:hypothetical protein